MSAANMRAADGPNDVLTHYERGHTARSLKMLSDRRAHTAGLSLTKVKLATTVDGEEARLVMSADDRLVAVLVSVVDEHSPAGTWFLEAGFGPCQQAVGPIFANLDEACSWIRQELQAELTASPAAHRTPA